MKQYKRPLAKGCHTRGSKRKPTPGSCRLCVDFPLDMFTELREYAVANKLSLNEAVRTYVTWGMESL
jgi:hypothetical protein